MPQIGLRTQNIGAKGDKGDTGAPGTPGAGAVGVWTPAENGFVAASCPPMLASSNATFSAGVLYFTRMKLAVDSSVAYVSVVPRSPAGAGLANTFLGIYTISGGTATLLAQTNDISSSVQAATGVKAALTAPTATIPAGTTVLVAFLCGTATTVPTMFTAMIGVTNNNLTATSPYISGAYGSGLSALPASFALSGTSAAGNVPFMALS